VSRTGLVRVAALLGAAACVLVAFKVLPGIQLGADLGRQPALIVNDTATAVTVARCADAPCSRTVSGTVVPPGGELRAGGGTSTWVVEVDGARLGCLSAAPGRRLPVSGAGSCPG
jgi:hypothetical protein